MAREDLAVAATAGMGYGPPKNSGSGSMLNMIPMLGISLIAYTIGRLVLGPAWIDEVILTQTLVSGDPWVVTYGHVFLLVSMVFLFIELLRATETGTSSIVNHGLSMVLAVAALLLFILVPGYGNSIFLIFMSMTFLDFTAGFIVTTVTARRDFGVTSG